MSEQQRLRQIAAIAMEFESKQLRDRILAQYTDREQESVRHLMNGIARRMATIVARSGRTIPGATAKTCRAMRRGKLEAIKSPWLRKRVEQMVIERFKKQTDETESENKTI